MPTSLRDRVTVEDGRRSQRARRNITPQAVILELMDKYLPELPDAASSGPGGGAARG